MELETAVRRHLIADEGVNGYVTSKVFKNALLVSPQGGGGYAIVVRRAPGWAQPDRVKTSEFPRLMVECYADPDRNSDGTKKVENGTDKAWGLFRVVDQLLHARRDEFWGAGGTDAGLRIITCARDSEPTVLGGPTGDARAPDPLLGDLSVVQALYAVQAVH